MMAMRVAIFVTVQILSLTEIDWVYRVHSPLSSVGNYSLETGPAAASASRASAGSDFAPVFFMIDAR